jgi:uncharacterized phage protein (TIGR01671 family)
MREIKFRAWDNLKNEMMGEVWELRFGDQENVVAGDRQSQNFTLMQYTGLKDKNGKEIYEGDVMADRTKPKYRHKDKKEVVVWVEQHPYYPHEWHLADNNKSGEYSLTYENWEIIGNIHQNPDLLK